MELIVTPLDIDHARTVLTGAIQAMHHRSRLMADRGLALWDGDPLKIAVAPSGPILEDETCRTAIATLARFGRAPGIRVRLVDIERGDNWTLQYWGDSRLRDMANAPRAVVVYQLVDEQELADLVVATA